MKHKGYCALPIELKSHGNRLVAQILQCTRPMSHSAPFCILGYLDVSCIMGHVIGLSAGVIEPCVIGQVNHDMELVSHWDIWL